MLATEAKEKILETIKNSENGMTDRELAEKIGLSEVRVNWYLNRMMEEDENLFDRTKEDAHSKYVYTIKKKEEEPKVEEDKVSRLYNQGKNAEGYVDPTSAKAMKSVGRLDGFMAGGIYKTNTGSWFLVLRPYPDTLLGYNIEETTYAASTDRTVAWPYRTFTRVVYVNRLQSLSPKKLRHTDFSKCPFETMREIIRKSPLNAARVIEIEKEVEVVKEVEKPVEVIKEVEKIVEKEVPVVKEVFINDAKPATYDPANEQKVALLKQRISIYETLLKNFDILPKDFN